MSDKGELRCPTCGGRLELYEGDNPHKRESGFCSLHGRVHVEPVGALSRLGKALGLRRE